MLSSLEGKILCNRYPAVIASTIGIVAEARKRAIWERSGRLS